MTAARFFGDAFRVAATTFSLLTFFLGRSLSATFLRGFTVFSRRGCAEASFMLFRVWPVTMAAIPTGFLAALVAAGQYQGWLALGVFIYAVTALYVALFFLGVLAGGYDRLIGPKTGAAPGKPSPRAATAFEVPENLKEILSSKIRGQDLALEELSNAVITSARNFSSGKPLGMYLLVGATGSGKTETAKQLSAALGWPLYREECNQYATQHSITRLIGAAAGYKESENGGSLTNALRSSRHGVLLLDEIEKAHPSVARALMTLADEGYITTALGEVIDARGWLILATSNASQAEIVRIVEDPKMRSFERIAAVKKALENHWPPEIIARMRSVVPYKPVDANSMRQVFEDMLMSAAAEAGGTAEHTVYIQAAAIDLLSEAYISLRQYGVREMRNFIDRDLGLPLMRLFQSGALEVVIDAEGDKLVAFARQGGKKRPKASVKGFLAKLGLAS